MLTALKTWQVGHESDLCVVVFFPIARHMLLIIRREKLTLLQAKERRPLPLTAN